MAARTKIFIVRTTPHPPTNVTVTKAEAFSVTLSWMPGYSGCGSCEQSYKIRSVRQNFQRATLCVWCVVLIIYFTE